MGHPRKKPIRGWRVVDVGSGVFVYCDPSRERLALFDAPWKDPPTGMVSEQLTGEEMAAYVDATIDQMEVFDL